MQNLVRCSIFSGVVRCHLSDRHGASHHDNVPFFEIWGKEQTQIQTKLSKRPAPRPMKRWRGAVFVQSQSQFQCELEAFGLCACCARAARLLCGGVAAAC